MKIANAYRETIRNDEAQKTIAIAMYSPTFFNPLAFLRPPYRIGQAIIFLPCGFFFLSIFFFPHLISAVADWIHTYRYIQIFIDTLAAESRITCYEQKCLKAINMTHNKSSYALLCC